MALGLFACAFLLRLLFIFQISDMPTFDHPVMDEGYHIKLTDEILSGKLVTDKPFYRAPLFPCTLALLRKVTGDNLFTAGSPTKLLQLHPKTLTADTCDESFSNHISAGDNTHTTKSLQHSLFAYPI